MHRPPPVLTPFALTPFALIAMALLCLVAVPALATTPYGEDLVIEETTAIADILDDPEAFDGQDVRVEGEVTGVCAMAGCWIELQDDAGRSLRVKVDDGVIVFPPEAVGEPAVAEGTVRVREMSREDYVAWQRHLADELGESFDEASVGDGPHRLVQLAGRGAEIGE